MIETVEPFDASKKAGSLDQVNRSVIALAVDVPGPRRPRLRLRGPDQGAAGLLTATVCLGAHPAVLHAHLRVALTLLGTDSARLGADLEQ
ncbi:MAG: hypothetical protein H7138_03215 [Myxococcales bacterium]|nr:hypothetical protein [Myxococcales bacterium]